MHDRLVAFLNEHTQATRRYLLRCGAAGAAAMSVLPLLAEDDRREAALQEAIDKLEAWLTAPDDFRDVSRGKPKPHSLDEAKRKEVGLTRDTWKLEVISDPENRALLRRPLCEKDGTAFTFDDLQKLAETHAVRFAKVMTCLNIGCPLGNGVWEGVPLREVLWLTQPTENLRRVFYYGYHNDDPQQMFRSSLPAGRVLEDLYGLPPVILCYKLNGQWLTPERGGPVRVVVPEAYGFKSIKWLTHVVLSNEWKANDTYGEQNNDVDSPLKTFCDFLNPPAKVAADQPFAVTGFAQVGVSGLTKVQVWMQASDEKWPEDDPHFSKAPWRDAEILAPPTHWGGGLPDDQIPAPTHGFDEKTGRPQSWPLRLTHAHWAALLPGSPAGDYVLRCRTIDAAGVAQPLPRPFHKSGRAAIAKVRLTVAK
ncbi:MAG: molybdopterin-dependent oxidoreductase [Planctomycetales bacterium]|nr:molybdopterin-dependent oxidoreductase [Planctomycetales bacterium]